MSTLLVSPKPESFEWCERELAAEHRPLERVEDGPGALDALARLPFERVIVDLRPDAHSGLAALTRIRAARADLPVVALVSELSGELPVQAFRAGAGDVAAVGDGAQGLAAALARASGTSQSGARARITAVLAASGGLGVTSLCVSLCHAFAARDGCEVLLADLDLYLGSARGWLPEIETAGPHELLAALDRLDAELLPSLVPVSPAGFRLVSGSLEIQDAEAVRGGRLRELFQVLAAHHDELVLDLPHDFSTPTLTALDACDRVLLVVSQDPPTLRRAQAAVRFCAELGLAPERMSAVVQRFDRRADLRPDDVARVLGIPVAACIPRDDGAFAAAARERKPLAEVAPNGPASRAIAGLAAELVGAPPPARPFWSRLLGGGGSPA